MKVLLINGSPHAKGCTYTALREVADTLEKEGIETEIYNIGTGEVGGCMGCRACATTGKCIQAGDCVNEIIEKAKTSDGFIFGSPVHYAAPAGKLCAVLDRCFYAGSAFFKFKPGAAVVSCRRAGSTAALDRLTKYFTISNMPLVSSQYWCMVHGNTPDEVRSDGEGMQTMRLLGMNTAWLLKCIELGKNNGIDKPVPEPRIMTNFHK